MACPRMFLAPPGDAVGEAIWFDTSTELILNRITIDAWQGTGSSSSCLRHPRSGMSAQRLDTLTRTRLVEEEMYPTDDGCNHDWIYVTDDDGTRTSYEVANG